LLLVGWEFISSEHAAGSEFNSRGSLHRGLSFSLLLRSFLGLSVDYSNFGLNVGEVSEHRKVKRLNFSSGPSHLHEVELGLSDTSALQHGGSHEYLPGVLAEVRADRVESNEHLLHVHHEDVGVRLVVFTDQVGLLNGHEFVETVLNNVSVVEALVAFVAKVKTLVNFTQEDFVPVVKLSGVSEGAAFGEINSFNSLKHLLNVLLHPVLESA